ncbi:MAG: hypothetical protein ACRCVN_05335 [Spirochaetia bacterium]
MLEMVPLFEKLFFLNDKSKATFQKLEPLIDREIEEITTQNVYTQGISGARPLFNDLVEPFILPGSRLLNAEHLQQLYQLSQQGHACLLLPEHYGNFDLTNLCYLTDKDPLLGPGFADSLVAVAGAKLSLENKTISTCAQVYNRVVIYPSRGIDSIQNDKEREEERKKTMPINLASIQEVTRRKYNKQMFLVFPSGTRIRPWREETKTGVPEIYNYLRIFEYACLVSVNGNNLPVSPDEKTMTQDIPEPDHIFMNISPVIKTTDLIAECAKDIPKDTEMKAFVVTNLMKKLFKLHEETEEIKKREIS